MFTVELTAIFWLKLFFGKKCRTAGAGLLEKDCWSRTAGASVSLSLKKGQKLEKSNSQHNLFWYSIMKCLIPSSRVVSLEGCTEGFSWNQGKTTECALKIPQWKAANVTGKTCCHACFVVPENSPSPATYLASPLRAPGCSCC